MSLGQKVVLSILAVVLWFALTVVGIIATPGNLESGSYAALALACALATLMLLAIAIATTVKPKQGGKR